jgi:sensor histidine kinase YesM
LDEELEILLLYIDLEKMRLENAFTFSCEVEEGVDLSEIQIPPLLMQPFVENAIWHGLMEKGDGHLSIKIYHQNEYTYCEIEDNGIGRQASQKKQKIEQQKYRSLGMGITSGRIELFNKLENLDLDINIIDLGDHSRAQGTSVILSIKNQSL